MPILGIIASSRPSVAAPVAGYKVWLDASDTATITESGNAVSAWTDKSVNAYVFEQLTATNKPTTNTRTLNSLNVLDFDGSNDFLESTATASTWNFLHNATGGSIFMVLNSDTAVTGGLIGTTDATPTNPGLYYYIAVSAPDHYDQAIVCGSASPYVVRNRTNVPWLASTTQALGLVLDPSNGTTLSRAKLYRNDNTDDAVNGGADGGTFTTNNAFNTINICGGAGNYFNGRVAEIVIYDSQLSSGDVASNMTYLSTKWGI